MKFKSVITFILIGLKSIILLNAQTFIEFKENGKYGLKDEAGNIIVEANKDLPLEYKHGVSVLLLEEIFIIDTSGKTIFKCFYPSNIKSKSLKYADGLFLAQDPITSLYGYIDTLGHWVIQPKYYEAMDFSYGCAFVCEEPNIYVDIESECGTPVTHMKWGVINTKGLYIITPIHTKPLAITAQNIIFDSGDDSDIIYDLNGTLMD